MRRVEYFQTEAGREPFREWLQALDKVSRRKIHAFIIRLAAGGAKKNVRSLGDGIFEIKVDYGPGYRIYFGEASRELILLLVGGDKSSQFRDIRQAKEYWSKYVSQ
ncbi:MAG: type II toxin-antitoxin system RelE/ParE family toxin [Bdellovibrionia bacterium]